MINSLTPRIPSISPLLLLKQKNTRPLFGSAGSGQKLLLGLDKKNEMENEEINIFDENKDNTSAYSKHSYLLNQQPASQREEVDLLATIASLSNADLEKRISFDELLSMAALYSPIKWELKQDQINAFITEYKEKKKSLQNPLEH